MAELNDVSDWLSAEREHQLNHVAGALADAMLSQETPMAVPGPMLYSMAERMVTTGVRHGSDWSSLDESKVVPQWVRKGMEDESVEPADVVVEGALPSAGVARAVSWEDLP